MREANLTGETRKGWSPGARNWWVRGTTGGSVWAVEKRMLVVLRERFQELTKAHEADEAFEPYSKKVWEDAEGECVCVWIAGEGWGDGDLERRVSDQSYTLERLFGLKWIDWRHVKAFHFNFKEASDYGHGDGHGEEKRFERPKGGKIYRNWWLVVHVVRKEAKSRGGSGLEALCCHPWPSISATMLASCVSPCARQVLLRTWIAVPMVSTWLTSLCRYFTVRPTLAALSTLSSWQLYLHCHHPTLHPHVACSCPLSSCIYHLLQGCIQFPYLPLALFLLPLKRVNFIYFFTEVSLLPKIMPVTILIGT